VSLSKRLRRRQPTRPVRQAATTLTVVVLASLAIDLSACGASPPGSSRTPEGVRDTLRAYVDNLHADRFGAVCGLLTKRNQATLGNGDPHACPKQIAFSRRFYSDRTLAAIKSRISHVEVAVHGNQATLRGQTFNGGPERYFYVGGRWLDDGAAK
jgi:hypothetical protein